ncbi:MAG: hypothetical protein JZU65_13565, partial [Chlorobium sp.]|nr:hypothetical protein [Chlorobium sp.]
GEVERGLWTGGDPDYIKHRNPAAVALSKMRKGKSKSPTTAALEEFHVTEARRLQLVENARKPKGLRAVRTETLRGEIQIVFNRDGSAIVP